jgi:5-methyltetrahydrofolate--homocysteine methyltransferase
MMNYEDLIQSISVGDESTTKELVQGFIDSNVNPIEVINDGLMAGMNVVGEKFKKGDMFVPEVLMAARSMSAGIDLLKPLINEEDMPSAGTVVIGTVKGDLHDIGKNLVGMMMESVGMKVINVGVDVGVDKFVETAKEHDADIIAMSAMLTTTMINMKAVIKSCKETGLKAKFMIGGAPVTDRFASEIGAVYTADASTAAEKSKELV